VVRDVLHELRVNLGDECKTQVLKDVDKMERAEKMTELVLMLKVCTVVSLSSSFSSSWYSESSKA
jgi:hypothetical protein